MALLYDDSRSTIFHAGRLALIYAEGNDADKAIACNRRALEIALKYGDKAGQIASRGSLG